MNKMKKNEKKVEYNTSFDINSAILYKKDLLKLEEILVENSETDSLEIKLSFDNITITAESFDELFANPNISEPIENLSMDIRMIRRMRIDNDINIISSISLLIFFTFIKCLLRSSDQTWFLGKKSQIEKFFAAKKPWYSFLSNSRFALSLVVLPLIIGMLFGYIAYILFLGKYSALILPIVCFVTIIIIYVLIAKQKIFPVVKIYLKERTKKKFGLYQWVLLITLLASIATIVQFLTNFFN
jgi:hypothetical protein